MSQTVPAPKDLKPAAQARWETVYPRLAKRGNVDQETLRTYCQVWARWQDAENSIQKAGQLSQTPGGRITASPLIQVASEAAKHVRTLEDRLGITAVDDPEPDASGDELVTRKELARRLGVHMQTVTKWEREGLPVATRGRRGRASTYSERSTREWLEARESAAQKGGLVDVARERARKERAQAILAEQTFQTRARELLPAAEVEKAWLAEIQAVRTAILSTYTTQADRVHRAAILHGVVGVERELRDIAHELLRELSEGQTPEKTRKRKRPAA
jgi:P27 family predicted phage terminase small subunit